MTGINNLNTSNIFSILEKSRYYFQQAEQNKPLKKILDNKVVANIFFEDSTRTRFSFEIAAKKLGADVINFSPESSSVNKGESLLDTLKTFESLGVDFAVIRHSDDELIQKLSTKLKFHIINAGAGKEEHPSQSLLDIFTIQQEFKDFKNLKVGICGDIKTSRVAKSNIKLLDKLGIETFLSGPDYFLPKLSALPQSCEIKDFDQIIPSIDVLMFLRIQNERHSIKDWNIDDYHINFGLSDARVNMLKNTAIFMHPAPVNRGVEIADHLIEHEKSRIFKQMKNGVFVRMAIFDWLLENSK